MDSSECALENVYFSHIKTQYIEEAKGLDDLLVWHERQPKGLGLAHIISTTTANETVKKSVATTNHSNEVIEDLLQYQFASRFFHTIILTDGRLQKVYQYLGLKSVKDFYQTYQSYIGNREFSFKCRRYQFDGEEVKYVRHEDSDKYLRVGPDWLKIIKVMNKYGEAEEEIIPYKIGEIKRDYAKYPDFIDSIPKYDAFCNVPCWDSRYKRIHESSYNLCNPLSILPKAGGKFPSTIRFLRHLFRGEGSLQYVNSESASYFTISQQGQYRSK